MPGTHANPGIYHCKKKILMKYMVPAMLKRMKRNKPRKENDETINEENDDEMNLSGEKQREYQLLTLFSPLSRAHNFKA